MRNEKKLKKKKIIIIRLQGGLGNQMFQYAFSKSLALATNSSLILDLRIYDIAGIYWTNREYGLSAFQIDEMVLCEELFSQLPDSFFFIQEQDDHKLMYAKELLESIKYPCYFEGYWQSWKYFHSTESFFHSAFCFKENILSPEVIEFGKEISKTSSVSIHIRRTDYFKYPHLGVLPVAYYYNAIEFIKGKIQKPFFYIFSDDSDWVDNYFNIPAPFKIVKDFTDVEDLYLMSH